VAAAAVAAYRRRSFLGRHPTAALLVFGISPLMSFIVLWLSFYVVLLLAQEQYNFFGPEFSDHYWRPVALTAWSCSFNLVFVVIPCTLASLLYCELAQWLGLGRKWMYCRARSSPPLQRCIVFACTRTTRANVPASRMAWDSTA